MSNIALGWPDRAYGLTPSGGAWEGAPYWVENMTARDNTVFTGSSSGHFARPPRVCTQDEGSATGGCLRGRVGGSAAGQAERVGLARQAGLAGQVGQAGKAGMGRLAKMLRSLLRRRMPNTEAACPRPVRRSRVAWTMGRATI